MSDKTEFGSELPWDRTPNGVKVAVVGDLILDEYLEGHVHRISPEAPVPVHMVTKSFLSAGGAANVARNVQLAGGRASMIGVCGEDQAGRDLIEILISDGIDCVGVLTATDRSTIKKTRISSNHQQLVRVDWERIQEVSAAERKSIFGRLSESSYDVILLSDYGKGSLPTELLRTVINYANKVGVPTVVDPKGTDYERYREATVITPNRKEAMLALGLDPLDSIEREELAKKLQDQFGLRSILLTLGAEGMFWLPEKSQANGQNLQKPIFLPAKAREVFDVSGAGDTVAALIALGLGARADLNEVMQLANLGAGLVVEKWGTQPVYRGELMAAWRDCSLVGGASFDSSRKLRVAKAIAEVLGPPQSRNKKVVFTNGCFDLLHEGHVSYLEKARQLGDILVVGVNSDDSVRRLKGAKRPITSSSQRMRVLAGLACVDYVVEFEEDTPELLIEQILPNVLVKGADYGLKEIVGAETVKSHGGVVDHIPLVPGISTTDIVERIRQSMD